jgi:hypothetical protein
VDSNVRSAVMWKESAREQKIVGRMAKIEKEKK